MVDDLDEFVAQLQGSGRRDSQGRFSLDLRKAMEKLARFRLPGSHDYVLGLVAAATLSGATRLLVRRRSRALELAFDGRPFSRLDLQSLFPSLLLEEADPRLRELAVGLHASPGRLTGAVRVESGGTRATLRGDEFFLEPATFPDRREPGLTTRIRVPQPLNLEGLWRGAAGGELALLRERCAYGPLRLVLEGRPLDPPRASLLCAHRYPGDGPELRLRIFGAQERLRPGRGFQGICGFTPEGGEPQLVFILNGVAFPQAGDGFPPGFRAWLASGSWRRDLSGASLVQDAAWQRDLDALHYSAINLLIEYSQSAPFLEPLGDSLLWLLRNQGKLAESLPLFERAQQGRCTLLDVRGSRDTWGGAFVAASADLPPSMPDGSPILKARARWERSWLADSQLPLWPVEGRERPATRELRGAPGARLVGRRYLAQVASETCELGLPDCDPQPCYHLLIYRDGRLHHQDRRPAEQDARNLPNGLDCLVALDSEQPWADDWLAGQTSPLLGRLFRALVESSPEGQRRARAGRYLLECLAKANALAAGSGRAACELLRTPPVEEFAHSVGLELLIHMAYLPTAGGGWTSPALASQEAPSQELSPREVRSLKEFFRTPPA